MSTFLGPTFRFVEEARWEDLLQLGAGALSKPLLVKGAVRTWPAWECWSFERLAELHHADGKEVVCRFQDGLVEQGSTRGRPELPIAPYLRELAQAAAKPLVPEKGLLPLSRRQQITDGTPFHLDWAHLRTFEANRLYLSQWHILKEFPELRGDFAIRTLWPGLRWTWEYVFMGPADTVTGLHRDFPHNWFCQVRGTKEVLLFPPDQTPHLCVSKKYDWGAILSDVDISRLHLQPREATAFAEAQGFYARVEAGDALFIPKRTWHAVVALEPSISLGIFGLTAREVLTTGAWWEFKNILHNLGLYRGGHCTCHPAQGAAAPRAIHPSL